MRYAYFNPLGRVDTAHNDDTITVLPAAAMELTEAQFESRFDLLLVDGELISDVQPAIPPAPMIVPVSPRQIRQALSRANLRAAVEAAIAAGDQDGKDWWEFSTQFERLHPKVMDMGHALGESDAAMDALWILAGSL